MLGTLRPGVNARMRAVFFRSLATMFSSGVSLVAALDMLAQQQEHAHLAEACQGISRKLHEGHTLSWAMQKYPAIFRPLHQKMVLSGERSGQLHSVLLRLAEREEMHDQLVRKLKTSLTMPLLVSSLCVCLAFVIPPLLFRGLFEMIAEVGGTVPWPTRSLMALSSFFTSPLFPILGLAVLYILRRLWQRLQEEADWQFACLRLPYLGDSLRMVYVTDFAQNLRAMLEVGMPILAALELSARATDMVCIDVVAARAIARVKEGDALSDALAAADFFPSSLIQGVRASEEAGRLATMLKNLETIFRLDLDQRLEVLTQALEPLVLLVIGTVVGFTVIATLQPMLSVLDKL